jgi:predicted amidohydrolase
MSALSGSTLTVALITEIFPGGDGTERLRALLAEARRRGAELAVLPELPLNAWSPATRHPRDEDAEGPGGPRAGLLAAVSRGCGIGVVGGVIHRDPESGRRTNRALVYAAGGELRAAYDKAHLPSEEGYWEADHYQPGEEPPRRIGGFGLAVGIQICSDLNRPQGCHLLGALGVEAILAPRATPAATYPRWRTVLQANAVTSATYLVSVNRPRSESGTPIGGPSVAVAPDGRVLLETTEPLAVLTLEGSAVARARREYPGYLALRSELYARGWQEVAGGHSDGTGR